MVEKEVGQGQIKWTEGDEKVSVWEDNIADQDRLCWLASAADAEIAGGQVQPDKEDEVQWRAEMGKMGQEATQCNETEDHISQKGHLCQY